MARSNVTQRYRLWKSASSTLSSTTTMDSFDNFQYDSASSYGGMGVVDDTSSVYTANTQDIDNASVDLSSLALSEYNGESSASNGRAHHHHHHSQNQDGASLDEDFDAVLDDLKDESVVDLPPHACRCAK